MTEPAVFAMKKNKSKKNGVKLKFIFTLTRYSMSLNFVQ